MVAQQDSDGVIFDMRERCVAMAAEIAGTLNVLAEAAANAPPMVRDATLTAISQVAAAQERLSDETRRLPVSSVEQFALMQDVLQAQRGTLIELVLIVKQLGLPSTELFTGGGEDTQLAGYQPSAAPLASRELRRAVFVSRRVRANAPERFPNRGAMSRIERRWRSWSRAHTEGREERRAARAHRSSNRQFSWFFKAAVSRSLWGNGAIFAMRERYVAMTVEIASTLIALAEAAANAPPKVRDATLAAISRIAAAQERLSDEMRRPGSSVEQFALMQGVLQAQRGALIELALIVKQLGVPATGPFTGGGKDTQLAGYQPSAAPLASPELRRAIFVFRRVCANAPERVPNRGAKSRIERRWRSWSRAHTEGREERRAARTLRSSNRQLSWFFRAAVSWTLWMVIVVASGLLIAYGALPRAGDPEPTSGRLRLAPRTLAMAKPLPVPRGEPSVAPQRTALVPSPDANTRVAMRDPVSAAAQPEPPTSPPQERAPSVAPIPASGISFSAPIPVGDRALDAAAPEARPLGPVVPAKAESVPERTMLADVTPLTKISDPDFVAVLFTHKEQAVVERYVFELQRRFPAQLLDRKIEVQAVDMGEKGVWHRLVLLPPGPREQADTICQILMAGGYDRCWVKNY